MQAYSCQPCNVSFSTEQAWQQHLLSAQHLSVVEALLGSSVAPMTSMMYGAGGTHSHQYQLQQQQQQQQQFQQQFQLQLQQQQLLQQQSLLSQAASSSVLSPNQFQALQMAQLASNNLTAQDPLRSTIQQMQKLQQTAQAQQRAAKLLDLRQQGSIAGLDQLGMLQSFQGGLGRDSILGSAPGAGFSLLSQPLFSIGVGQPPLGRHASGRAERQPVSKFTVVKKTDSGRPQLLQKFPSSSRDTGLSGPPDEPGCCRNCGNKGHGLRDCPHELLCTRCGRRGHTHHVCHDGGRGASPPRGQGDGPCRNCSSIDHSLRNCPREIFCTRCRRKGHTHHVCNKEPQDANDSPMPFGTTGAKRSASQTTPFDNVSSETFGRPKGAVQGEAGNGEPKADGNGAAAPTSMPFGPSSQPSEASSAAAPFGSNIVMPTLFPFGNSDTANSTFSFGLSDPDQPPEPAVEAGTAATGGEAEAEAEVEAEREEGRGKRLDLNSELAKFKSVWNATP